VRPPLSVSAQLTGLCGATRSAKSRPKTDVKAAAQLVRSDDVMPVVDGFEVCRRLRSDPATQALPVVMITASAREDRVRGLEAGADDFLTKPIDRAELIARVGSLLRIKSYYDTVQAQAEELADWNLTLERRVDEQVDELQRLGRLRRFLSPHLADLIVSAEGEALLEGHRRLIAVMCCRLPGFEALVEAAAPEDILTVLGEYHETLGEVIFEYEGTVGPLLDDRLTVYFNDPLPVDNPAGQAVRMALALRSHMEAVTAAWGKRGLSLDFARGLDLGYATLGTIGFSAKRDYVAVGSVVHIASGLCDLAQGGQILITPRVQAAAAGQVDSSSLGEHSIGGLLRPLAVLEVLKNPSGGHLPSANPPLDPVVGPLSERELEVAALVAQGLSNRDIARQLIIADATAVRHVANILNKLDFRSRAQIAVWADRQGLQSPS
jgi:adenylate cyclase